MSYEQCVTNPLEKTHEKLTALVGKPVYVTEDGRTVLAWFAQNGTVFSFDTETDRLEYHGRKAITFQFYNGNSLLLVYNTPSTLRALQEVFPKITTLIIHNSVFDLTVCHQHGLAYEHIKIYDTMVAQHLLDEESALGLKHLARTLLCAQDVKDYDELEHIDSKHLAFQEYALKDVYYAWKIAMLQQPQLKEQGLAKLFREIEMPFMKVLVDMQVNGMIVDVKEVATITQQLEKEHEDLLVQMLHALEEKYTIQMRLDGSCTVVSPINFNSTQQLGEILFDRLGLPRGSLTEKGAISVDKETLRSLKDKHPFVAKLLQYKITQKLLAAFFVPMPEYIQGDGRIRAHFNDCGTKTGRLSSSSPNMQQLPRVKDEYPVNVRKCFTVNHDEVMISADYSGQELRILAHITKDKGMIESFKSGKDLHLDTANRFFNCNIPQEALFEGAKEYDKYKKLYNKERNSAKIINFGIAYGKGSFGFAQDFGTSEDEAQKILDRYFTAYPNVKKEIDATTAAVKSRGYVVSDTGRRRRFTKETDGKNEFYTRAMFRKAFNFRIQGYASDMIRMAANKCWDVKKQHPEWNMKFLATIHDEILFSCKKQYQKECAQAIKDAFETAVTLDVPVVSSVAVGNNYAECK